MSRVAIIGNGVVGKGMRRIWPRADIVDPAQGYPYANASGADLAVVCVPTPMLPGGVCDTSAVLEAVKKANAKLFLVKSTVAPGTCEAIAGVTGKRIVFSPEYMGESTYWTPPQFPQPTDPVGHGFVILGGDRRDCAAVADELLPVLGPATRFRFMTATEAELVKYAENAFFALKVTFAGELRRICEAAGVSYHQVREGWLDDPRVGPMHTAAFKEAPGFSGKCLPKDTAALANYMRCLGLDASLLEAAIAVNARARGQS